MSHNSSLFLLYKNRKFTLITADSNVCHGKACIRHMRWPVEVIIDLIASGMSFDGIISDHPELEKNDILAALATM